MKDGKYGWNAGGRSLNYGKELVPQKQPGISMPEPGHKDIKCHRDGRKARFWPSLRDLIYSNRLSVHDDEALSSPPASAETALGALSFLGENSVSGYVVFLGNGCKVVGDCENAVCQKMGRRRPGGQNRCLPPVKPSHGKSR
jgi:hypothetical protein